MNLKSFLDKSNLNREFLVQLILLGYSTIVATQHNTIQEELQWATLLVQYSFLFLVKPSSRLQLLEFLRVSLDHQNYQYNVIVRFQPVHDILRQMIRSFHW